MKRCAGGSSMEIAAGGLLAAAVLLTGCERTETKVRPSMPRQTLCTPTPLPGSWRPPNMEANKTPVLEVSVPEGVRLLSLGMPVMTSDPAPIGRPDLITDGDKRGDDGYYIDLAPGRQWVQIDLGESKEIWLLWVWHFHKLIAVYNDVVVQISDDPGCHVATTVFNNDYDNSSGLGSGKDPSWEESVNGRAMPVAGVTGRYVRFWSNGRDIDSTNHYIEIEVYGM